MSRQNLFDGRAEGLNLLSGLLGVERKTLDGTLVLLEGSPILNVFDPGGSDRDVSLPAFKRGLWFFVGHDGTDNVLNVKDSSGIAVGVVHPGELQLYACSGNAWTRTPGIFGVAGAGHSSGLVPDPGAVSGLVRFLADDGTWKSVTSVGIVDAYKTVTDGTNSSVAAGLSTLKFRSSDSSIEIVVTNNDATHGDNVNLQVTEANVNHDALQNFVADEHVAHSGVTVTGAEGLSGGGAIDASRVIVLDIASLTAASPVALGDTVAVLSAAAGANRKATLTAINAILDHNALLNYSANQHVDHTAVILTAGVGLTGGGDISVSRSFALDINGLSLDAPSLSDTFAFYDVGGADHNKATFTTLNSIFDHNALLNYEANRHIDHTAVSILTGADSGLTGGGTIAANRSLSVDINGTTEETTVAGSTDFLLMWDTSAGALRKVKPNNLPAGAGDVLGPASAVVGNVAQFSNISGKQISDSGVAIANLVSAASTFGTDNTALRADGTGRGSQSSVLVIADSTGALSRSGGGGIPLQGTNTNDSAAAGDVGQTDSGLLDSGSATSLTTGTAKTVTSVVLAAGDYIVWGTIGFLISASATELRAALNTVDNTLPSQPNGGGYQLLTATFNGNCQLNAGMMRVSVASPTTYRLIGRASFASGTVTAFGTIWYVRIR